MNKKTLIIIHPHFTIPGGAGKVALEIGKRLASDFKIVAIAQQVFPEYRKAYPEITFENINGPLTSSFLFWFLLPFWYLKTASIIKKYSKQNELIIFASVFPANWISLPYKIFHPKTKCFWYCHEPSAFIYIKKWRDAIPNFFKRTIANILAPILAIVDKKISNLADVFFVNSKYSQFIVEEVYKKRGVVAYPGVETELYKPVKFDEKNNYILTVCRLTKFKNVDLLIKAFSKLKESDYYLYILGDGEEKENLKRLAEKLNVQSRVKFFSNISDDQIIKFYAKAKLFVLCSKNEPFGIVPIEAMACGTPVIADNSGGPMETIIDQKTGFLIDCNESNLTKKMSELLNDNEKLERFSQEAREHVKRNFTWDLCVLKLRNNFHLNHH